MVILGKSADYMDPMKLARFGAILWVESLSTIESEYFCPQITQITQITQIFKSMNYEISRQVIGCAMAWIQAIPVNFWKV